MKAAVLNHPLWGRRRRTKQIVLACLIVVIAVVVLGALGIVNIGDARDRGSRPPSATQRTSSSLMTSSPAHR